MIPSHLRDHARRAARALDALANAIGDEGMTAPAPEPEPAATSKPGIEPIPSSGMYRLAAIAAVAAINAQAGHQAANDAAYERGRANEHATLRAVLAPLAAALREDRRKYSRLWKEPGDLGNWSIPLEIQKWIAIDAALNPNQDPNP